jgi:acetyltransferase-like isoleucine patch superfamily enzyme
MFNRKADINSGYFTESQLKKAGFREVGVNVQISKNCTIVGPENVSVGDNVRIDGYSIVSASTGSLKIGHNVHIGAYSYLVCKRGITIGSYSTLSQGVRIYTVSDDYSGMTMTNPTISSRYKNLLEGEVILSDHVIIGSGSIILPNVTLGVGAAVGALSMVKSSLPEWGIYAGVPARLIRSRRQDLLELVTELKGEQS